MSASTPRSDSGRISDEASAPDCSCGVESSSRPPLPIGPLRPIPITRPSTRKTLDSGVSHVTIIGAGLSGLTAALRIAGTGRSVTVIERSDSPGGRAATEEISTDIGDVRLDTGATVLTMPHLVESAVASVGLRLEQVSPDFRIEQLSPAYSAYFASGRSIGVYADQDLMEAELARFGNSKGVLPTDLTDGYRKFRRWSRDLYNATIDNFINADFDSFLDMVSTPDSASDLARVFRLGGFGSLDRGVRRRIKDDEVARLFLFQSLYAGVSPAQARSVYATIAHMDTGQGVYYPTGGPRGAGMGAVCDVFAEALTLTGATIHFSTEVTSINTAGDTIRTVTVCDAEGNSERLATDAVIATCDIPVLEELTGRKYKRKLRWSPSAMVIHGAIDSEVSEAMKGGHHTISFGSEWDQTFSRITARASRGSLMKDPSLLVTRPARTASSMRVSSSHGSGLIEPMSILVPCPNLKSADLAWDQMGEHYAREIVHALERRGFAGISDYFSVGRIDTPMSWRDRGFGAGSPFAAAHSFAQTGPMRTRNFQALGLNNLILAGATTTPGVGVPTAMMSGALAARRITGGGVR